MTNFETIQDIIAESLMISTSEIQPDSELAHLKNMDSLTFEMILVAIENKTGKTISPMDLMTVKTVGDLVGLLG